jgi:squalene-hopene/tetraprenyl-beta-curcumene cyclase
MATDTSMMLTPKAPDAELERSIALASKALLDCQQPDGHWVFELEVDATIPAEYVLLKHYLGERDELGIESKIAGYLRRTQRAGGGLPLVYNGAFDLSASVKAYFALKMIGDRPDAEHMQRACQAIRDHGGAARTNALTRALLALY